MKIFILLKKCKSKLKTAGLLALFFLFIYSVSYPAEKPDKSSNKKDPSIDLSSFNLQQNYPNPFNPATQINYYIPVDTHVKLIIYNMLGNKVATLVDEDKSAGEYSVQFNASSLSSGVYIYRLQTNYFTATKKLTFLK